MILCIDDEKIILDSLRRELRQHFGQDYEIEIADDGEDALDLLEEIILEQGEVPVVICDYIMPVIKGDEILMRIHRMSPLTRTIMLTGQSSTEGISNAINRASLYRFIAKPWNPADLKITLQEALKSYYQEKCIEEQTHILAELNFSLEKKVQERTEKLNCALKKLQKQKELIEQKQEKITASIRYAQRIQAAILPPSEQLEALLDQYFLMYRPRDIVSGDFYWCEKLEAHPVFEVDAKIGMKVLRGFQNEKTVLVVADCTGHGVPGAFMSMIGNDLLNTVVIQKGIADPGQILEEMHDGILKALRQTDTQSQDGMDIGICVIDHEEETLAYSGARIPLLYIQAQSLQEIPADKMPVGGIYPVGERSYTTHTLPLAQVESFYLFTDGYQDQFGGPRGKKFLPRRLRSLIQEVHTHPLYFQKKVFENTLSDWKGSEIQLDDILVMGVRL